MKSLFFLTDLQRFLHARSCIHFLWPPHTPSPPRPLTRPQHFKLLFHVSKLYLSVTRSFGNMKSNLECLCRFRDLGGWEYAGTIGYV